MSGTKILNPTIPNADDIRTAQIQALYWLGMLICSLTRKPKHGDIQKRYHPFW